MKLNRLLTFAAVGVGVGLLLTKTEKGRAIKNDITDKAGEWGKRLSEYGSKAQKELTQLVDDGMDKASKMKKCVNGEVM